MKVSKYSKILTGTFPFSRNSCELTYISCKKYWDLREVSKVSVSQLKMNDRTLICVSGPLCPGLPRGAAGDVHRLGPLQGQQQGWVALYVSRIGEDDNYGSELDNWLNVLLKLRSLLWCLALNIVIMLINFPLPRLLSPWLFPLLQGRQEKWTGRQPSEVLLSGQVRG